MILARLRSGAGRTAAAVRLGSRRFLVATLAIVLFTVIANLQAGEAIRLDQPDAARLLSALYAGGLASVAVRLFLEARPKVGRLALDAAPALAAVLFGLSIVFASPFALFAGAVTAALFVLVPLAPFLGRGTPRRFWDFTLWTVLGSALALAGVLLFLLALFALIALVGILFGQTIGDRLYLHLSVTALSLIGPLVALGRIPPVDGEASPLDGRLSAFVRPIVQWIAAPFTLALAFVLHLYGARALLQGGLGHDEIGWIAAFFLALVYGLRLAIEPYRDEGAAIIAFVARWWAVFSLVPLLLLSVAAYERIGAQGVTLSRYYLVLLCAVAAVAFGLQAVRAVRNDIRWLAGLLPAALLLSAAGPLGAPATVTRSQSALIEAEFGNREALGAELSAQDQRRLRSRLRALETVDAVGELERFGTAPGGAGAIVAGTPAGEIARAIGAIDDLQPVRHRNYRTWMPIPTDGFDRIEVQVFATLDGPRPHNTRTPQWVGTRLVFAGEVTVDLADFLSDEGSVADAEPVEGEPIASDPIPAAPVLDLVANDGRTLRVRVEGLTFDDSGLPETGTFSVLYRAAEFPDGLFGGD